jgi:hypothetical protein
MMRRLFIAVAAIALLPVAAEAAMVQALDAPVSLNRGAGFQRVVGTTEAGPGDLVLAGNTGRAEIIYDNGCREIVEPGQTVAVKDPPPRCRGVGAWLLGAAVVGGVVAIIASDDDDDKPVSP